MEATMENVLARLQRLEDLEAIRHTWRDYCIRLDSEDWVGLGDVYTEDAVLEMNGLDPLAPGLDGTYRGRRTIIDDFYKASIGQASENRSFLTGHLSTNMQIDLKGDEATTLAYFFEIIANNLVLIGTYQHRFRREPDRWRFAFLRISVRYAARIEASGLSGQSLTDILAKPV
jgi:hypothetical protein